MFTLFLTVAAVVLVSLIVFVTLHFTGSGGQATSPGRVEALRLLAQGQKVVDAAQQYKTKSGNWPANVRQLVDAAFLPEAPTAKGVSGAAVAWTIPAASIPVFVLAGVASESVCREVNNAVRNVDGIARKAYTGLTTQCYGAVEQELFIVMSAQGADLMHALPPGHAAQGAAPSDPREAGWLRAPTHAGPAAPPQPVAGIGRDPVTAAGVRVAYTTLALEPSAAMADAVPKEQPLLVNTTNEIVSVRVEDGTGGLALAAAGCEAGVPAHASCSLALTFRPGRIGAASGKAAVVLGDAARVTFSVTGVGTAPPAPSGSSEVAGLRVSRQTADFGEVSQMNTAETAPLVLTNVSGQAIPLHEMVISDDVDYAIDYSACLKNTTQAGMLQSGESCEVALSFSPHAAGPLPSLLTLNFEGGALIVRLTGTGREMPVSGLEARVDGFSLGDEPLSLGVQSDTFATSGRFRTKTVRMLNTGGQVLVFSGSSLSPRDEATGFEASAARQGELGGCERVAKIAPGEYCDIFVGYQATNKAGAVTAELTVRFTDQTAQALVRKIVVTAKAYEGWLALVEAESGIENGAAEVPGGWNFERVAVGGQATKRYLLRNKGAVPVGLRSVLVTPGSSQEPPEGDKPCVDGLELQPAAQCALMVTFAPGEPNPQDLPSRLSVQVQTSIKTIGDEFQVGNFMSPNMLGWVVRGWTPAP